MTVDNSIQVLREMNPHDFTYEDLKKFSKANGLSIEDITSEMKLSIATPRNYARNNNGVIGSRYFHVLYSMILLRKQSKVEIPD